MKAQGALDRVRYVTHDHAGVRWPDPEMLGYIADAQQQVVSLVPSATSDTRNLQLVDGNVRQTLPDGIHRILSIHRNMGADGNTPGPAVVFVSRSTLDAMDRDWHRQVGGFEVEHWSYQPTDDSKTFYVVPAPSQAIFVEATVSVEPPGEIANPSDDLLLPDRYINSVVEWVLYRAFSKDADFGGNHPRAAFHRDSFFHSLGLRVESKAATNPNRREG